MWNLRNLTEDMGEGKGKKWLQTEREGGKPEETLKYRELRVNGGWWWGGGKWVMGTEEGTCWDEHWVLYISDESWESTPETKGTLYTMYVS